MNPTLNLHHSLKLLTIGNVKVGYVQNNSYLTTIQIFTKVGSQIEQPDQYGIAHILEHMFFKGSKKRPGPVSIPRAANDIGAHLNAYTTYDHTSYYITALNDSFEQAADILFDMFLNPLFPEAEFQKELKPILSEYRDRDDDPDDFINERALERYYGKSYHPIIGTEKTIRSATAESMHNFKNKYYNSNNVVVVIVGGIAENRMQQVLSRYLDDLPFSDEINYQPLMPVANTFELKRSAIQEAHYNLFFQALPIDHPRRHHEDLFNYVLGGSDSSFLFERIREELGLSCYSIDSMITRNQSFQNLNIACAIDPDEIPILEREVEIILQSFCEKQIDQHHLDRAKISIRTSIASRMETSTGIASLISSSILRGEVENPISKLLRELEDVTVKDIQEIAGVTLSTARLRCVLWPK